MNCFIVLVGLLTLLVSPGYASATAIRLSTPDSHVVALVGITSHVAILVSGATSTSRTLTLAGGPGEVVLDQRSRSWLWRWRADSTHSDKIYTVTVRDKRDGAECSFSVTATMLRKSAHVRRLESGIAYTGIKLIEYSEQPGMKGRYEYRVYLDDSLAASGSDRQFSFAANLHGDLGKEARVRIEYTAPLTERPIILGEYRARLTYPPLRAGGQLEVYAGDDITFIAALGVAPYYYVPIPSRFLLVSSDGRFEDTALMVNYYDHPDSDPYEQFQRRRVRDTSEVLRPGYDFVLRQSDKAREITEPAGVPVLIKLTDPSTGQATSMNVRIFPRDPTRPLKGKRFDQDE